MSKVNLRRLAPRWGWRFFFRSVADHRAYFRGAEYPMGRVESWVEALRFCWVRR